MGNGISHLFALTLVAPIFDADGDEFGCALTVTHNGLRQVLRRLRQRGQQGLAVGAV